MKCSEIMTREPITLTARDNILAAAKLMRTHNVGFLPICDQLHHVIGVITDRDIATRVVAEGVDPAACLVGHVMTKEILSCQPDEDTALIGAMMTQARKNRVVIVDEHGVLLGTVSLVDLAARDGAVRAGETLERLAKRERRP